LWLDASDTSTITEVSGAVSQWNNKGNLANVSQGNNANKPTTGASTQNGLNVINFDGNDRLAADAGTVADWKFLHDGTKWIAGVVIKAGTDANPNALYTVMNTMSVLADPSTDVGVYLFYDDRALASRNNAVGFSTGSPVVNRNIANDAWTPNQFTVLTVLADLGNATPADRSEVYFGSGSALKNNIDSGAPSSSNPATALAIGALPFAGAGLVGSIGEIVVVSGTAATPSNRQALRDYLTAKWAL
jgi:hypothetical protein